MSWFCQRDGRTSAVRRRSLDLPSPTICVGGMGDALAGGYWLEMNEVGTYYAMKNVNGRATGRRYSVDEPAQTVLAEGIAGDQKTSVLLQSDDMPDALKPPAPGKPPYRVQTMAEVAAIPWNGLTVVSLFAGAGGSSTGYRMAGYRVLWASEFVPAAQESYRANMRPGTVLDCRDVRDVQPREILAAAGLASGEIDVLDGSPPCQAFSTAGKRAKGWGQDKTYEHGAKQRNEELFSEYVRILRGLMPRAFVAENVSGLVKGVAKGFFLEILADLKASGYRVEARLLDAQWLGVPQQRSRVIFVGVRDDLGLAPAFPSPLPYRYSVRDALPWLSKVRSGPTGFGVGSLRADSPAPTIPSSMQAPYGAHEVEIVLDQTTSKFKRGPDLRRHPMDEPMATIMAEGAGGHTAGDWTDRPVEPETDISRFAIGVEADNLVAGQKSKKYFQLERAHPDKPSPAVLASAGEGSIASVIHPTEKRKFTIAEVRRLCSFPDDFVLTGSYAQQWARLGNSVPPLMMKAVAEAVKDRVLLPARAAARTAAPAGRSPARSKSERSPKGAAPSRPASRRTGANGTKAPAPARTRPAPRGPASP